MSGMTGGQGALAPQSVAQDVTAVVTGCNQGEMLADAVDSVLRQTVRPASIIVVDDGSEDVASTAALEALARRGNDGIRVIRQANAGVSAARNAGIAGANTPYICVLDGDDLLLPRFLERTLAVLREDGTVAAASGWLKCFGVLDCVVRPGGGTLADFLPRNCCPSACLFRRELWQRCGGYDESMREGFEDWEFCLVLLEAGGPNARIAVIEEPLVNYRTAAVSSNVKSMERRTRLLRHIIGRHREAYAAHVEQVTLALDALASSRLRMWEDAVQVHPELMQHSMVTRAFLDHPTYGDGGMAAAVRINRARCSAPQYPSESR